jgi:PadR family transcriptional regulator, regulatory protein PadR
MKGMREATYYSLAALLAGPAHGYAVLERVREMTGGSVRLTAGTLYGVLDRLADEGLIRRAGSEIVRGRARNYFEITETGSAAVQAEAERMAAAAEAVRAAAHDRAGRQFPQSGKRAAGAGAGGKRLAGNWHAGTGEIGTGMALA